jgi:hypothetical protein
LLGQAVVVVVVVTSKMRHKQAVQVTRQALHQVKAVAAATVYLVV